MMSGREYLERLLSQVTKWLQEKQSLRNLPRAGTEKFINHGTSTVSVSFNGGQATVPKILSEECFGSSLQAITARTGDWTFLERGHGVNKHPRDGANQIDP